MNRHEKHPSSHWYERQTTEMHKRSMALAHLFYSKLRCHFREPDEIKPVPLVELRRRWMYPDFERKLIWAVAALVGAAALWGSKVLDRQGFSKI